MRYGTDGPLPVGPGSCKPHNGALSGKAVEVDFLRPPPGRCPVEWRAQLHDRQGISTSKRR